MNNRSYSHLRQLMSFWLAIGIPISIALIVSIFIILNSNFQKDLSYEGWNFFYTAFKVPISIGALSFPLVALVATVHRSRQTYYQLESIKEQNTVSNYFKHREEFFELLTTLEKELSIHFFDSVGLYKKIFPENTYKNITFISAGIKSKHTELEAIASMLNREMDGLLAPKQAGIDLAYVKQFFLNLYSISCMLHFKVNVNEGHIIHWPSRFEITKEDRCVIAFEGKRTLKHAEIITDVLEKLWHFAHIEASCDLLLFSPTRIFNELANKAFDEIKRQGNDGSSIIS